MKKDNINLLADNISRAFSNKNYFAYTIISSGSNAALQAMSDDYLRGRIIGLD